MKPNMKKQQCPWCDYEVDAASAIDGDDSQGPSPGDYSVCLKCTQVVVFGKDMSLQKPNEAQGQEILSNETLRRDLWKTQLTLRAFNRSRMTN